MVVFRGEKKKKKRLFKYTWIEAGKICIRAIWRVEKRTIRREQTVVSRFIKATDLCFPCEKARPASRGQFVCFFPHYFFLFSISNETQRQCWKKKPWQLVRIEEDSIFFSLFLDERDSALRNKTKKEKSSKDDEFFFFPPSFIVRF